MRYITSQEWLILSAYLLMVECQLTVKPVDHSMCIHLGVLKETILP